MQKNKTKKTLLLFASSFLLMSLASACKENTPNVSSSETTTTSQVEESKEPVVTKALKITHAPNKTIFKVGETLDLTGMVVKLVTSTDGVEDEGITVSDGSYTLSVPEGKVFSQEDITNALEIIITYNDDATVAMTKLTVVVKDLSTFAVLFKNYDGNALYSDSVKENRGITYEGEYPTRPSENGTSYFFDGWYVDGDESKTLVDIDTYVVTKDVTFVAHYVEGSDEATDGTYDFVVVEGKGYSCVGFHTGIEVPTEIAIPDMINNQPVVDIAASAFKNNTTAVSVTMGDHVESIGKDAFYGVKMATSIHLSTRLKTIGEQACRAMKAITSLEVPGSLEVVSKDAFNGMIACSSLKLNEGIKTICATAFYGMQITKLDIPDSVVQIIGTKNSSFREDQNYYGSSPFQSCKLLTEVHIGAGLKDINEGDFNATLTGLQRWTASENSPYFTVVDGILYSKDMKTLVSVPMEWCVENEAGEADLEKSETFTVKDGVETIGYRALNANNSVTRYIKKIVIGKDVKTIQGEAFKGRKSCEFDWSKNTVLNYIGYQAFYYSELTEAILPESLTFVGDRAFASCSKLVNVRLGRAMTHFGDDMFSSSKNVVVSFPEDADYHIEGEMIYNKDVTKALYFNGTKSNPKVKEVVIPSTVTEIADGFLKNVKITSLTLNEGLQKIGASAFYSTKITSLTLPSTVKEVGPSAFTSNSYLTSLTLNDTLSKVGEKAFYNLSKAAIKKITIPADAVVGASAFSGLSLLEEVDYQAKELATSLFQKCTKLAKVTLSNEITSIPKDCFYGTSALKEINLPTALTTIEGDAFNGNAALTSLSLPSSLTTLADAAFEKMTALTNIEVPASVTKFGTDMFSGCSALANVVLHNPLTALPESTFDGCSKLKSVTLPEGMTGIERYAFNGSGLETITLPATVITMADHVFANSKSLVSFVGSGVTSVGANAFENCTSLTSASFSPELTEIASSMFKGCASLKEFVLTEKITMVGYSAFQGTGIENFVLPSSATFDKANSGSLLRNCTSLKTAQLNSSITALGTYFFDGDKALTTVTGLSGVTSMDTNTFSGCSKLTSLDLDVSKITAMGSSTFLNCASLTTAYIPTNAAYTEILESTFEGATSLTTVTIPENVTLLSRKAFKNCSKLTTITIEGAELNTTNKIVSYGVFYGTALSTLNWQNGTLAKAKALLTNAKTGLTKGGVVHVVCGDGEADVTIA